MRRIKYVASVEPRRLGAFQKSLLRWYRKNGRDLPWRRMKDPYAVIVSEIMLHQTTVATVLPVFLRFLEEFPDITSLHRAPVEQVKAITDPLGYKVRGRWLKEIARLVVEDGHGQWPKTVDEWMAMPGVGRYTAGAVVSLAFNQDVPILDTNVKRVLGRYFGLSYRDTSSDTLHQLWALAEAVVPKRKGRPFNQALMDFGAMMCTARNPHCRDCPILRWCLTPQGDASLSVAEEPFVYRISIAPPG